MPQQLKILNSKEAKAVHEHLRQQYGFAGKLDLVLLRHEKQEKLYAFAKELAGLDISKLRIDAMGLYFGAYFEGKLRLTIDGSQRVGPDCTRNIVELTPREMQMWLAGYKLQLSLLERPPQPLPESGEFVILRCGADYLGCGKIGGDLILNYIPKTRHIHAFFEEGGPDGAETDEEL